MDTSPRDVYEIQVIRYHANGGGDAQSPREPREGAKRLSDEITRHILFTLSLDF